VAAVLGVARTDGAAGRLAAAPVLQPIPAAAAQATPGTAVPEPEPVPAAVAPVAPAAPGDFAFLATDGTRPVRYDPCTPIHYAVNLTLAPAGAPRPTAAW